MEYKTLIFRACEEIPDFEIEYKRMIAEAIIDRETGIHIVF